MPTFFTANLGRHVTTGVFLRNVEAIDDEAGRGAVIGFQEIDEDDVPAEHRGLRSQLGDDFTFAGWESREPIAFGARWSLRSDTVHKGVPGLKVGAVGLSPARTITDATATHASGHELVFLDLHYPRNDPRLASRWQELRAEHRERVRRHVAAGHTVVWFSDVNRVRFAPLHPDERTLAHHGLDWIRCVEAPGGTQIEVLETGSTNLTIDGHDAQWARVALHPAKETR